MSFTFTRKKKENRARKGMTRVSALITSIFLGIGGALCYSFVSNAAGGTVWDGVTGTYDYGALTGVFVSDITVAGSGEIVWSTDVGNTGTHSRTNISISNPYVNLSTTLPTGYHYEVGQQEWINVREWIVGGPGTGGFCGHNECEDTGALLTKKIVAKNGKTPIGHCSRYYYEGSIAACNDCGKKFGGLIYASNETLSSIKRIPNGSFYYYLA